MIIIPTLIVPIFKNGIEFCRAQWYITLFLASIAIMGKINSGFALWIYNNFYSDDGRLLSQVQNGGRVVIIDAAGATASVIFMAGCICAFYLIVNEKGSKKNIRLLQYCFVLSSLFFIGRTGLYMAAVILLLIIFYLFIKKSIAFLWGIILLIFGISVIYGYIIYSPDSYIKQVFVNWAGEIFIKGFGEGSTFSIIAKMEVPEVTKETFWGTGIVNGITRFGTEIFHDSGYIQTYAAIGIPGTIMYYGSIITFYADTLYKNMDKKNKWILGIFLLSIMICEYKEPFLRKTPLLIILSSLYFCERKLHNKKGRYKIYPPNKKTFA